MTALSNAVPQVRLKADKPARHKKAVVFCCDDAYLPFAAHAAAQINDLHPDRDFDLCICRSGPEIALPQSLADIDLRLIFLEMDAGLDALQHDARRSFAMYLRLFAPDALAGDYARILYLDADIFIQGGNFSRLLDVDIGSSCIAAIRDNIQWRTPLRKPTEFKKLRLQTMPYFNSGVMLIDTAQWQKSNVLARAITFAAVNAGALQRHDQTLLNAVLIGCWAEMSPLWNWQFSQSARLFATLYSPNVIHFIGPAKPWKDHSAQFEPRFARSYARFIKTHFPDHKLEALKMPRLAPDSPTVARMLFKHLLSRRKMARYLARFPSDMTVFE